MARDKSTLSLAMSALSTGGFVKHTHTPFNNAAASASPHAPPAESRFFDYTPAPIEYRNRILNKLETGDHIVRYVRFPSAGLTRQPGGLVHAHYWHGKRPGQKPLLIVLPIFGSYTYPTEAMVRTIRRHYGGDCHVLQIVGENYLLDWFGLAEVDSYEALTAKADEMAEHMRIAVIDLKRCVDWALTREEIDAERIALIGFSMGAFLTALTLGVEPRLRAGVVVLGGAHPAGIIASCGGKPGMAKAAVMERLGLSWEEYFRVLENATCSNDPAHFEGCFRPERILLFDALYDTCMPARSRAALWQAMGQPERYTMHYGHKSAFLAMTPLGRNFMRRKTLQFLDRVL
ncbi:MAG TPA: hypothetical protein VFL45_00680 [Gammaproteobacteria bacterium]|nr:hypothetical protein [Gammaproteobacteria bacterium]